MVLHRPVELALGFGQDGCTMALFPKPKNEIPVKTRCQKEPLMKRILAVLVLCAAVGLAVSIHSKDVPSDVQQALIALDKQWGNAGPDTAKLDKIIGDDLLAVGAKGEAQNKKQLIADNVATASQGQNTSYTADEYKFNMLSPDVVVMTHCGTTKSMQNGKEVTESHRSPHIFQKQNGEWRVVANAQMPITMQQHARSESELWLKCRGRLAHDDCPNAVRLTRLGPNGDA